VQASPPKRETPKQTPPVVWQISQAKLKELQWKRAQLRQFERERAARNKTTPAKRSTPKSAPDKGFRKSFQAKESTVERGEGIDSQVIHSDLPRLMIPCVEVKGEDAEIM
jgi:hypothetical protein